MMNQSKHFMWRMLIAALLSAVIICAYADDIVTCPSCGYAKNQTGWKFCNMCGASLHAHMWREATYDAPETCTVCGETQGTAKINWMGYTPDYYLEVCFWGQKIYERGSIRKVVFTKDKSTMTNAWDMSRDGDGNILAWVYADTLYVYSPNVIVLPEDSGSLFYNFVNVTSIQFNDWVDTSHVTNMTSMFSWCRSVTDLNLSCFDTSSVTSMSCMFNLCESLNTLNLSSFNTSKVTDMSQMFGRCNYNLTSLNLSNFDTSQVTDMSRMFWLCNKLVTLDLSSFNTSKVTDMSGMFSGCSNLKTIKTFGFDMSRVTEKTGMFEECPARF